MTQMIDPELHFDRVFGQCAWTSHNASIVDQYVQFGLLFFEPERRMEPWIWGSLTGISEKEVLLPRELPYRFKRAQIAFTAINIFIFRFHYNFLPGFFAFCHVAACHVHFSATPSQFTHRLVADASIGASHDDHFAIGSHGILKFAALHAASAVGHAKIYKLIAIWKYQYIDLYITWEIQNQHSMWLPHCPTPRIYFEMPQTF